MKEWWVNTAQFLPDYGEHVLVFHNGKIKPCVYTDKFRGMGYGAKVHWWMEFPSDDWYRMDKNRPPFGVQCMTLTAHISMETRRNSREITGNGHDAQRLVYWRRMPEPPTDNDIERWRDL